MTTHWRTALRYLALTLNVVYLAAVVWGLTDVLDAYVPTRQWGEAIMSAAMWLVPPIVSTFALLYPPKP